MKRNLTDEQVAEFIEAVRVLVESCREVENSDETMGWTLDESALDRVRGILAGNKQSRGGSIPIYLSAADAEEVMKRANERGLSLSEYVRLVAEEQLKK